MIWNKLVDLRLFSHIWSDCIGDGSSGVVVKRSNPRYLAFSGNQRHTAGCWILTHTHTHLWEEMSVGASAYCHDTRLKLTDPIRVVFLFFFFLHWRSHEHTLQNAPVTRTNEPHITYCLTHTLTHTRTLTRTSLSDSAVSHSQSERTGVHNHTTPVRFISVSRWLSCGWRRAKLLLLLLLMCCLPTSAPCSKQLMSRRIQSLTTCLHLLPGYDVIWSHIVTRCRWCSGLHKHLLSDERGPRCHFWNFWVHR